MFSEGCKLGLTIFTSIGEIARFIRLQIASSLPPHPSTPQSVYFLALRGVQSGVDDDGRRQSGDSEVFPAIKTASDEVSHENKTPDVAKFRSYGELGLG